MGPGRALPMCNNGMITQAEREDLASLEAKLPGGLTLPPCGGGSALRRPRMERWGEKGGGGGGEGEEWCRKSKQREWIFGLIRCNGVWRDSLELC